MFRILFTFLLLVQPASATWNWYTGDFASHTPYPPDQLTRQFQDANDNRLDYRIFYNDASTGHFMGLSDFLLEEEFHSPDAFTPILGTALQQDSIHYICVGVDPRSPIPSANFPSLEHWAKSQGGVVVLSDLPTESPFMPSAPVLIRAYGQNGWLPACEIGGKWDSLLTQGNHIGIVGGTAPQSHTFVWAESPQPEHLFNGLNNLSTWVSESANAKVDFRVDDQLPGSIFSPNDNMNIRVSVFSEDTIQRIDLIADGQVIWSDTPFVTTYNERISLAYETQRYVRAEIQTQSQIIRTSPVFLASEYYVESIDLPVEQIPFYLSLDSVLESLTYLPIASQARVLSEYISHERTRFAMVLALDNRPDLLSEELLARLSESPYPQVRLGAAFIQVMRNAPNLSAYLFQALSDPDPSIQKYAARMLLQYATITDASQLPELVGMVTPDAKPYLILAQEANTADPETYRTLIRLSQSPHRAIALSSQAKLFEMGNRNYRVIRALRDSALAGHIASTDILGTIGDDRVATDIEKVYLQARPGQLKYTAFQALQKFHPDKTYYPNRPELRDRGAYPLIDGLLMPTEWDSAAYLGSLGDDFNLGNHHPNFKTWMTHNNTHLLFAVQTPLPDTTQVQYVELQLATHLAPQIPFTFVVNAPHAKDLQPISTLTYRQSVTDSTWTIEGEIPFTDLGLDPNTDIPYLRLNTSYITPTHRWTWSPTYGKPDDPERFGTLYLHKAHSP